MAPVLTHRSKTVVEAARLHRARHRRETGLTILEGPALLADALAAGCSVRAVFAATGDEAAETLAGTHGLRLHQVEDRALARVAGTNSPRGPVAVVEIPDEGLGADGDVLVSWGVSDPGNVGALIRTAAAFGWGFAYVEGTADPWAPKTLRAGAGGQFQTRIAAIGGLDDLASRATVATVVNGGDEPSAVVEARLALLIGEEAVGLPEETALACDRRVSIPTPGPTESLNAAVAAGIIVSELSKRPGRPGATSNVSAH